MEWLQQLSKQRARSWTDNRFQNINEDDEIATNGLWYVDDDGHFQRLVDTIIELKKEIAELKGNQNHE